MWKRDDTSFCWQEQSSEQIPVSYLADWILYLHVTEERDLLLVLSESCMGCLCSACSKGLVSVAEIKKLFLLMRGSQSLQRRSLRLFA